MSKSCFSSPYDTSFNSLIYLKIDSYKEFEHLYLYVFIYYSGNPQNAALISFYYFPKCRTSFPFVLCIPLEADKSVSLEATEAVPFYA